MAVAVERSRDALLERLGTATATGPPAALDAPKHGRKRIASAS